MVPPVVTGGFPLLAFAVGRIGAWLDQHFGFQFFDGPAALAAGVTAFPLIVRSIQLGIENVDRRGSGGHPGRADLVLLTVTLHARAAGLPAGLADRLCKALVNRRHHHIRFEHPGRHTLALGIYTALEPRRRSARCAWRCLRGDFGSGAVRVRTAGAVAGKAQRMSLTRNVRHPSAGSGWIDTMSVMVHRAGRPIGQG
jgi:hypothetical protein